MDEMLRDRICKVAQLRKDLENMNAEYNQGFRAFETQYADVIANIRIANETLQEAESELREATIVAFLATGNKHPAHGVSIRMTRQVSYSEEAAIRWAIEHGHTDLLKLNYKPFEQVAKSLELDFVSVTQAPEATIARDLEAGKK
jgi:hypothetical protein